MKPTAGVCCLLLLAGCATMPPGGSVYSVPHVNSVSRRLSTLRVGQPKSEVLRALRMQHSFAFSGPEDMISVTEMYLLRPCHALEIKYQVDPAENGYGNSLILLGATIAQTEWAKERAKRIKNGKMEIADQPPEPDKAIEDVGANAPNTID